MENTVDMEDGKTIMEGGETIMEGEETITINLEEAAQIILQEQDGAVTIAPGTYHILTQENGQIQLTADGSIVGEDTIGIAVKDQDQLTELSEGIIINEAHLDENKSLQLLEGTIGDDGSEQAPVSEEIHQNSIEGEVLQEGQVIQHGRVLQEGHTVQTDALLHAARQQEGGEVTLRVIETADNDVDPELNVTEQQTELQGVKTSSGENDGEPIDESETVDDETITKENETTENVAELVQESLMSEDTTDTTNVGNTGVPESDQVIKPKTEDKQLDLTKPIAVTNKTEVVINGKKCILMANPATGELCAYPVLPPPGKRRRGRPRKEEGQASPAKPKMYVSPATQQDKEQTASAAEGLLELGNTGPDGLRRSGRARKKAKLFDDYEVLEVSSDSGGEGEDEHGSKRRKLDDQKDYVPLTPYIIAGSGVKRGRGRPRRYPPPGQSSSNTQIPAVIIPGANGQSLMMAPIQGLSNLQAFQEHVKALPTLISKPAEDGQPVSLIGEGDAEIPLDTSQHSSEEAELTEAASSADAITAATVSIPTTDTSDSKDIEGEGDSQTIIQIPENLLPMFLPKKDPIKLGLKASESELGKMKCTKCDFQAYYAQQYQAHIASHAEDIHKCKCCNFLTFDRDDLLSHFKENHPRCICTECEFMAEHAYIIKRHMMRHSANGCTCEVCGRVYKDQYILKMHIKMVHMPVEVLFECNVCSKKFTRKAHLKRHLRIHEPEKPFKCPHCDYRGCERSDISKHLLIHEEPRHVCEVCGKAFRHIKNKELHLKRHNGQRDYKCGVCDFYGYTFTDIRKHIERKHADIKTLVCDKCGSAFKSEALLREHQKQQCDMFMIEQALAIANSSGGTSQATIQIPSSFNLDGQQITIDGQQIALDSGGQVNITVEQVTLPEEENITLTEVTEEQLQESLRSNAISVSESHIIGTDELGELHSASQISEAQIIECDDVDTLHSGIISVSEAQVIETDVAGLRDGNITVSESQVIETHQVQGLEGVVLEEDEEEEEEGVEEEEAMIQVVTDGVDISVGEDVEEEELSIAMPE